MSHSAEKDARRWSAVERFLTDPRVIALAFFVVGYVAGRYDG